MTKKNNKSRVKYYFLAALIVIMVALILIVPRVREMQRKQREETAFETLTMIKEYVESYWQTHESAGGFDIEKALTELNIKPSISKNWNFAVAWKSSEIYTTQMVEKLKNVDDNRYIHVSPFKIIMAVATKDNPIGEGRKLWFDGDDGKYHGFGADDMIEPDWARIFPKP